MAKRVLNTVIPLFVGVALFYLNSSCLSWLFSQDPWYAELIYGRGSWWLDESLAVKVMYVGVIAPFVEELLFRRLMLNHFMKKNKLRAGLAVSSVFFGLWHMAFGWGILKAIDMFVVGLIFGLVYSKWGFKGSLLTHYANNIIAVAVMAGML